MTWAAMPAAVQWQEQMCYWTTMCTSMDVVLQNVVVLATVCLLNAIMSVRSPS